MKHNRLFILFTAGFLLLNSIAFAQEGLSCLLPWNIQKCRNKNPSQDPGQNKQICEIMPELCSPPGGSQNPPQTPPGCIDPGNPSGEGGGSVYNPSDPNEIIGTKGYDALGDTLQWVAATASLPYTIYFENDPELATAAAQKVVIHCPLHSKADLSSFAVGAFGFGSHVFTVEGNSSTYQQRLDLIADMGIYVDVVAGIDIVSNEAFWIFQSIDPATGLPPQGTQEGFLPVNDENHSGEGFVSFTIKPKTNCITGDIITATASIVFDINEAVPTNVWHNTVDALPPTTQFTGDAFAPDRLMLRFSGSDDIGGCGIKQYKLYVSEDYGPYILYNTYPVGTEDVFFVNYDHCYRFFSLGEDNVGNVEEMKDIAEFAFGSCDFSVTVAASPEEGGTATGGGVYVGNSLVTVTATANTGYVFKEWIRHGIPVSTERVYTFRITDNCDLLAHFVVEGSVEESDVIPCEIFPNPTTGKFIVKAEDMTHITVTDVLGQVVYDAKVNADQKHVNLSKYESGLYLVRINIADGCIVKRVVLTK